DLSDRRAALAAAGVEVMLLPGNDGNDGNVDLAAVLAELGRRGINEVHVEAGAVLNGALLAAGLVDEWLAYLAPMTMGDAARGLFGLPELTDMAGCRRFRLHALAQVGADLRLLLRP
ncbi:MAG: RibD family protein, partial [Hydrogenophilaceae bacterium]|nr:RibD family protein [Hydrogenophilaceae bacterium]